MGARYHLQIPVMNTYLDLIRQPTGSNITVYGHFSGPLLTDAHPLSIVEGEENEIRFTLQPYHSDRLPRG